MAIHSQVGLQTAKSRAMKCRSQRSVPYSLVSGRATAARPMKMGIPVLERSFVEQLSHIEHLKVVFLRNELVLPEVQFAPSAARTKPRAQPQTLVVGEVVQQN